MKILIETSRLNDLGGIVPCVENLTIGLKRLGHEVDAVWSGPKTGRPPERRRDALYRKAKTSHAPWQRFPEGTGWWFRNMLEWWDMPTLSWEEVADFECDLLIHGVPVPTVSRTTRGRPQWPNMYAMSRADRQIVYVHDAHFRDLYPHLLEVARHIDVAVCVHEAAHKSCEMLPTPRALIPNPHDVKGGPVKPIAERPNRLLSLQNFKSWKHVDDLIRAVPHVIGCEVRLAGGGIEQQYMTSPGQD